MVRVAKEVIISGMSGHSGKSPLNGTRKDKTQIS